ncbi:hypothetical protein ARALYDRAFT_890773 [Arabidopsis lyrata subsp. lyrata]|uniref:Transmembrane protein n=1 Tax=Arabidopsis lyrata subsp. lyrata TaxID=81972 RepID=D7KHG0_ARALL|nr:hypothetical protein ARALYDRAFT_890773 [Arabidopsis lyrata subsp. lyrata]
MEDPLLSKNDGDSSSNEEHIVDITTDEQTPNEAEGVQRCGPVTYEYVWNFFDLALTLVQIVAAIVVMVQAKDKHPQVWIIGYTCGCIGILPCLCWRCWHYSPCFSSDSYTTRYKTCYFSFY